MNDPDRPDKRKWLYDEVNPDLAQLHKIRKVIYSGRTEFQSIEIVNTGSFGVCLVLDGKIQSSERDEFIYHEALVHPAMLSHRCPAKVFIAGGGEGATLREVLNHKTVNRVVMVDIDRQVIEVCRRFLALFHRHSFDDPRLELHITDARRYLRETEERFDVIVIDLVEPLKEGPACLLYTQEFYRLIHERMNPGGIMAVQSGAAGWTNLRNFTAIINTLRSVFTIVCPYQTYVPSFVDLWGFATASQSVNPAELSPEEIDRRISARLLKKPKSYDGITHLASFILPKHTRHQLAITRRVITDRNPIFVH
ncbi:MAG TPA: polyamine aminopropyltransferase [Dehalococcoidia bacterium]|nr:polyamine aminopropyltransferase [Dehalococcoidia bacterium]